MNLETLKAPILAVTITTMWQTTFQQTFGFIQNTTVSKISDKMDKFIPVPLYVGFIDFEINKYRFPRQ